MKKRNPSLSNQADQLTETSNPSDGDTSSSEEIQPSRKRKLRRSCSTSPTSSGVNYRYPALPLLVVSATDPDPESLPSEVSSVRHVSTISHLEDLTDTDSELHISNESSNEGKNMSLTHINRPLAKSDSLVIKKINKRRQRHKQIYKK